MSRGTLLLVLAVAWPAAAQQPSARDWRAFDQYVTRAVREWEAPGLAIAVVHGRDVVFQRGYGVRALGSPETVDEHTLFANASTSMSTSGLLSRGVRDRGCQHGGRTVGMDGLAVSGG